jgi:hypothetical protein
MERSDYTNADYDQPHVPPATPPVIDSNADAGDAATLADDDGDSDAPGSKPAHFDRSREDEVDFDNGAQGHLQSGGEPGERPDEVVPGQGDNDQPGQAPDEFTPGQGDTDMPDSAPSEVPAQPDTMPLETPLPPD